MNMNELKTVRHEEYLAELNSIEDKNSLDAYWAGSASASFIRDMKAGRFTTINADKLERRKRNARNKAALASLIKKG